MIARDHLSRLAKLERLYDTGSDDPTFTEVCAQLGVGDDDPLLSDVIEADGRLRLRLRRTVALDRYLGSVPGLTARLDPLDAAIDMTLRALTRSGLPDDRAVERLVDEHPELETAIREAAALGRALWSTTRLRSHLAAEAEPRALPSPFGPRMEDGRHRYELLELLGEGAFGQVYLAVDRQLSDERHEALVSIKVLTVRPHDEHERRCLIEEATKARRIVHPHVVRVLDRGVSDQDEDFIVYELVEGGDLARWRRRQHALAPAEAAELTAGIARGVHAAHMAGLVHCDLKPANVMLTPDGQAKVADFGIAILVGDQEHGVRRVDVDELPARTNDEAGVPGQGTPLGNLAFISPEQYRMEPGALTVPSDIYALGGILYWLLTAALPNGSDAEAIAATHDAACGRPEAPSPRALRALRALRGQIDHDLDAICRRALAPRREDRYGSAAALADDLESWARREPIAWTRPTATRRLTLWCRRSPALAAASVVIIMLAASAAVIGVRAVQTRMAMRAGAAKIEDGLADIDQARANLDARLGTGLETEVFPMIWLFEYMYGPILMTTGYDWPALWDTRKDAARLLVEKLRASGHGDDLETLVWETTLAFWLVHDGDHVESEPLLRGNLERWRSRLDADDPWLRQIEALRACAVVNRCGDGRPPVSPDAASDAPAELGEALAVLETAERELRETQPTSPLHELVKHCLGMESAVVGR